MPPSDDQKRPAFIRSRTRTFDYTDGISDAGTRSVPVETAVNIVYAPVPFAVMMATPGRCHCGGARPVAQASAFECRDLGHPCRRLVRL